MKWLRPGRCLALKTAKRCVFDTFASLAALKIHWFWVGEILLILLVAVIVQYYADSFRYFILGSRGCPRLWLPVWTIAAQFTSLFFPCGSSPSPTPPIESFVVTNTLFAVPRIFPSLALIPSLSRSKLDDACFRPHIFAFCCFLASSFGSQCPRDRLLVFYWWC